MVLNLWLTLKNTLEIGDFSGLSNVGSSDQLSATEAFQPLVCTDTVTTDLLAVRVVVGLIKDSEWSQAFCLMPSSSWDFFALLNGFCSE